MILNLMSANYSDANRNQRLSIANFLMLVYHCGKTNNDLQKEILNNYLLCLKVNKQESASYLQAHNVDRMFMDLRSLDMQQKTFLIILSHTMLNTERKPFEEELQFVSTAFKKIGVSEEDYEYNVFMTSFSERFLNSKLK